MQEIVVDAQNYFNHNDHIGRGWHSRLTPWEESQYRLISWLEMEEFTFEAFHNIRLALERMKRDYLRPRLQGLVTIAPEDRDIEKFDLDFLLGYLGFIKGQCQQLALTDSVNIIEEFLSELDDKKIGGIKASRVSARIDEIDRAISRGMSAHLFMHIPPKEAAYYQSWGESEREKAKEEVPLFGNSVDKSFPSVKYDIAEAGNCFALNRYTACVFHLMRVLEIGLAVFAKQFNVSSDHSNWHNIIEQIESKIRGMGSDPAKTANWKSEQEFYAKIASHFMFLKDAWRNNAMHAREKYTGEEAKRIMENVRAFMQKLATKFSE
jgi:hypothetical protein